MALELTHVLFARDLKDKLNVQNEAEYYAGTVYPDSRYTTGIQRDKTHVKAPLDPFVEGLDDFEGLTREEVREVEALLIDDLLTRTPDNPSSGAFEMSLLERERTIAGYILFDAVEYWMSQGVIETNQLEGAHTFQIIRDDDAITPPPQVVHEPLVYWPKREK
ncbi:MAG: hypothetical protein ABH851_03910 [Methanobacteriota archaeon]